MDILLIITAVLAGAILALLVSVTDSKTADAESEDEMQEYLY